MSRESASETFFLHRMDQKAPFAGRDDSVDENKEGGGETKNGRGEDKYGGDSEAAAAAKSSARARAANLGDSSNCEAEVKREMMTIFFSPSPTEWTRKVYHVPGKGQGISGSVCSECQKSGTK